MTTGKIDRISVQYVTNSSPTVEMNEMMFLEDFQRGVSPLWGSQEEKLRCLLAPDDDDFSKLLGEYLPRNRRHRGGGFKQIFVATLDSLTQYIVHNGIVALEKVKEKGEDGIEKSSLVIISSKELIIENENIIQVIHDDAAQHLGISNRIEIPKSKCHIIEFPRSLGGKKKYLKFLNRLRDHGGNTPMYQYPFNNQTRSEYYNYGEHQRLHDLKFWKLTKELFYTHRYHSTSKEIFSGYYYTYRSLLFRKTQLILRDFLIEEIQKIIYDLAVDMDKKIKVQIDGLTTIEDIELKIKEWRTGELEPKTISDVLY